MSTITSTSNSTETDKILMKKTKAQLIELFQKRSEILQDANNKILELEKSNMNLINTHNNLSKAYTELETSIDNLNTVNKHLQEQLKEKQTKYDELENDYEKECDENMSYYIEYKSKIRKLEILCGIIAILFIIACVF